MSDLRTRLARALEGRYRIDGELGRGGMAIVFLAEDIKHGRKVALKVLKPELAQSLGAERFLKEIRIAAQLSHPHLLSLHDSGEADGLLYYVMPYVEGESLRDRLDRERQLPLDEAVEIVKQVASALDHAHAQGVVHRDVKPENILLEAGQAVVTDFGIGRALDAAGAERLTETGLAVGTPAYMSPEQAMGDGLLDARSDVYSLACVAYEVLAGQPPFTGPSPQAILARHTLDPVPPLRTLRGSVTEGMERAVQKALAKAPADRYQGVLEFAGALERGVEEDEPPWGPRLPGRRRAALVGGVVALAAVAAWLFPVGSGSGPFGPEREVPMLSLAVLPVENLSGDPEQEYFLAGMHDGLISELGRISALRVISRFTMTRLSDARMTIQDLARELNVVGVVEASGIREGDQVRLGVRLIRAFPQEASLWSETFERDIREVRTLHSQVALALADRVGAPVRPGEVERLTRARTVNPETYEAYLRGMHEINRGTPEGLEAGMASLTEAVERNPGDALAYAGLALGYITIAHGPEPPAEALSMARAAAERAVRLDESLAEAHAALAFIKGYYDWEWDVAFRALERALEMDPNLAIAHYHDAWFHVLFGRLDEAVAAHKRAQELDPLFPLHTAWLGEIYRMMGRHDEALAEAERAIRYSPWSPLGYFVLGLTLSDLGRHEDALAAFGEAGDRDPAWRPAAGIGFVKAGQPDDARRVLAELETLPVTPWRAWWRATLHAQLGEVDEAFRWLEYERPHAWLPWIQVLDWVEPIREDPRFVALLRRMDLSPP